MIETLEDGLCCRWVTDYVIATDSMLTRFDCILAPGRLWPLVEPQINHVTPEIIAHVRQYYGGRIAECMTLARANPGRHLSCQFGISYSDLCDTPLRLRLPLDFARYGINNEASESATARSIKLLKNWLSPTQLAEYEKDSSFVVRGSDTGTLYRLISEWSYNIRELDARGIPTGNKFCVVPRESVAMGDQLLAQKIWIETDEKRTLKIANKLVTTDTRAQAPIPTLTEIAGEEEGR